jgi:hypothetical protein
LIASANADMLFHYWKVGPFILYLQKKEGWGSKGIDNLSKAIRSKYPDKKGYSTKATASKCKSLIFKYTFQSLTLISYSEISKKALIIR